MNETFLDSYLNLANIDTTFIITESFIHMYVLYSSFQLLSSFFRHPNQYLWTNEIKLNDCSLLKRNGHCKYKCCWSTLKIRRYSCFSFFWNIFFCLFDFVSKISRSKLLIIFIFWFSVSFDIITVGWNWIIVSANYHQLYSFITHRLTKY